METKEGDSLYIMRKNIIFMKFTQKKFSVTVKIIQQHKIYVHNSSFHFGM